MENFVIESKNKKLQVNGVEMNLLFDENEFGAKLFDLQNNISSDSKDAFKQAEKVARSLDGIFGTDFCKNVFGTSSPSSILLSKLFAFIFPYMEEFAEEHIKESEEKYDSERLGNV